MKWETGERWQANLETRTRRYMSKVRLRAVSRLRRRQLVAVTHHPGGSSGVGRARKIKRKKRKLLPTTVSISKPPTPPSVQLLLPYNSHRGNFAYSLHGKTCVKSRSTLKLTVSGTVSRSFCSERFRMLKQKNGKAGCQPKASDYLSYVDAHARSIRTSSLKASPNRPPHGLRVSLTAHTKQKLPLRHLVPL